MSVSATNRPFHLIFNREAPGNEVGRDQLSSSASDYEQSLFFLSPSFETRETRKLSRARLKTPPSFKVFARNGGGRAGGGFFVATMEHFRDPPLKHAVWFYPLTLAVEDFMIPPLLLSRGYLSMTLKNF